MLDDVADRAAQRDRIVGARTSLPSTRTSPSSGSISRLIIFTTVVLPLPDSPSTATSSPAATVSVHVANRPVAAGVALRDVLAARSSLGHGARRASTSAKTIVGEPAFEMHATTRERALDAGLRELAADLGQTRSPAAKSIDRSIARRSTRCVARRLEVHLDPLEHRVVERDVRERRRDRNRRRARARRRAGCCG